MTDQPIAVPATVHVFQLLGLQLTSGDLAHLQGNLPRDDLTRSAAIVCEYVKRWCNAMAGANDSQDKQHLGRYTANRWLSLGGHQRVT